MVPQNSTEPSLFDDPPASGSEAGNKQDDQASPRTESPTETTEKKSEDITISAASTDPKAPSSTKPNRGEQQTQREAEGGAVYHLINRLEKASQHTGDKVVHPRENRMWLRRDGAQYVLSLQRGAAEYPFTEEAIKEFAGLFDVPASLLKKLSNLPRSEVEDCRLLNMLLWAEGARPDAYYHLGIQEGKIVSAHTGKFTPLKNLALAQKLQQYQEERKLRVRWYDLNKDGGVRIEIEHIHRDPFDVSPDLPGDREADPDLWQPGVIVLNQEQGGQAATIVPTLFRRWGELTLPVLTSKADVRKHRHADTSQEALLANVVEDIMASREAPFQEMARRLHSLQDKLTKKRGVYTFLEGLNWPFPNKQLRDSVVARVTSGRPSLFRLVTATLKLGKSIDDIKKRHRLEMAVGQFVWSRGGGTSSS